MVENDGLFMAFDRGGAWWRRRRTKPLPDHITACHSERSEESDFNIINETFLSDTNGFFKRY